MRYVWVMVFLLMGPNVQADEWAVSTKLPVDLGTLTDVVHAAIPDVYGSYEDRSNGQVVFQHHGTFTEEQKTLLASLVAEHDAEGKQQAQKALIESAKTKLMAGEPLTEAEAAVLVDH